MKLFLLTAILSCIVFYSCNNEQNGSDPSVNTESTQTASAMDTTGMTKAFENFMTPGPMHTWLAKFNGAWDAEVVSFMNPEKPDTSIATNVYNMTLNGLYQEGILSGNMMGMPFEGHSITGYDNAKKMFVSTWVDNLGSGIVLMSGTYDETSKTLTLLGSQTSPMTGKDTPIKEIMKIIDDNTYTLEMYGAGMDGKEMKFMEATFKRKKG